MTPHTITFRLPAWLVREARRHHGVLRTPVARMRVAVRLAELNVRHGTGGPFAAIVVDDRTGRIVSMGVNLVLLSCASTAHAEMIALAMAQQSIGSPDLSEGGRRRRQLVSTAEPCAMCLGAVPWSGVTSLVCGARDRDVRAVGFDEGDKPRRWSSLLKRRGIAVRVDVLRKESRAVLAEYAALGHPIY